MLAMVRNCYTHRCAEPLLYHISWYIKHPKPDFSNDKNISFLSKTCPFLSSFIQSLPVKKPLFTFGITEKPPPDTGGTRRDKILIKYNNKNLDNL